MKIVFPKSGDYTGREEEFFEQMELALYHARKAWGKTRSQSHLVFKEEKEDVVLIIITD